MNLQIKESIVAQYQRAGLHFQQILSGNTSRELREGIANAKIKFKSIKDERLEFTRQIDDFVKPLMDLEKSIEAQIKEAGQRELALRLEEEAEAAKINAIIKAESDFKVHFQNEFHRIAVEYREQLHAMTMWSYRNYLEKGYPAEKSKEMKADIIGILENVQVGKPRKFEGNMLTRERMAEIYATIEQYDPKLDLQTAISNVHKQWEMYEMDLANAQAVSEKLRKEAEERQKMIEVEIAMESATNVLIAQAEVVQIETPKVKREIKVVIVESEMWAISVCNNFTRLLPHLSKYLRVKSWGNLTLAQMADAMGKYMSETGDKIGNLQTEEVCK